MINRHNRRFIIQGTIVFWILIGLYFCFYRDEDYFNYYIKSQKFNQKHEILPDKYKDKVLPFHQIYESRQISFRKYKKVPMNYSSNNKLILLWTPWNGLKRTINYYFLQNNQFSFTKYGCPNTKCEVTSSRRKIKEADAILFHLLDIDLNDLPKYRHPNQRWIAYNLEAPWLIKVNLTALEGIFNWTMNYRSDSDIVVKYGFIDETDEQHEWNYELSKKKPVVWFSSDCKTDGRREDYVIELSRYIQVDVYGSCGDKKCFPSQSQYCYEKILNQYVFYLSFENSICKDYVTEKFFNVFNYQTIPVVFGGADYYQLAPRDSFIDAKDYSNPRHLATYMKMILNDSYALKKYLDKKKLYKSYLYPWTCYLCDKLHQPISPTIRRNFRKWWINDAHCQRWISGKGFVRV